MKRILIAATLWLAVASGAMAFDAEKWRGLNETGDMLLSSKQPALAEAQFRAALSDDLPDGNLFTTRHKLATSLMMQGKSAEAVPLLAANLALLESNYPNNVQDMSSTLTAQAFALKSSGDTSGFEEVKRKLDDLQERTAASVWTVDPSTGELLHHYSGIRFSAVLGPFDDPNPHSFKPDGSDVGIRYRLNAPVSGALTIYVTQTDMPVSIHIKESAVSITMAVGNTEPFHQGEILVQTASGPVIGQQMLWEYPTADGPTRATVMIFQRGKLHIKFRSTYPVAEMETVEAALQNILKTFPWPSGN